MGSDSERPKLIKKPRVARYILRWVKNCVSENYEVVQIYKQCFYGPQRFMHGLVESCIHMSGILIRSHPRSSKHREHSSDSSDDSERNGCGLSSRDSQSDPGSRGSSASRDSQGRAKKQSVQHFRQTQHAM